MGRFGGSLPSRVRTSRSSLTVCYVVPYFDPHDDQHFAHLPAVLEEIACRIPLHVIVERGRHCPSIPSAASIRLLGSKSRAIRTIRMIKVAHELSKAGCAIFFVRYSKIAVLASWLVKRFFKIQILYWSSVQQRAVLSPWLGTIRSSVSRARQELDLLAFRFIIRMSDQLITGPESMKVYYREKMKIPDQKISVLPNAVDLSRFKPVAPDPDLVKDLSLADGRPVLLFVHRLSRRKGAQYLTPLAQALIERGCDFTLLVAGDGPLKDALVEEVDEVGLGRHVFLLGSVPNLNLPKYFSVSDVFVMPSEEEGFPHALLECLASGLPFVTFDVGGIRDMIGQEQQRYLVPRGEIGVMADRVHELLQDPALRHRQARLSLESAQRFGPDSAASAFEELVRRRL